MQFSSYSFPFVCSGQCALARWIYGCQFLKRPRKKYEDKRSSLQTLSLAPMPRASTVLFAIVLCVCGHPRKCVCVCARTRRYSFYLKVTILIIIMYARPQNHRSRCESRRCEGVKQVETPKGGVMEKSEKSGWEKNERNERRKGEGEEITVKCIKMSETCACEWKCRRITGGRKEANSHRWALRTHHKSMRLKETKRERKQDTFIIIIIMEQA